MNILYGVQTTGNGHICRSKEIIGSLKKRGHRVQVLLSGTTPNLLPEMKVFEPYSIRRGLTFITKRGRIQNLKTLLQLNFIRFYRDIRDYDASGIDLVITDFEPISSCIARRHGIPSIGISHQSAFEYDIPMAKGNPIGRYILRNFAPADHMVGLHWHHFDQPILPPVIPDCFENERPVIPDKIIVYLPFEHKHSIRTMLRGIHTHHFHIYESSCKVSSDEGNLHHRPFSRANFLRDLSECSGIICNSGFELPSEALHLGKRILAKPLLGQLEQESNALALSQLGLAKIVVTLNIEEIKGWLMETAGAHAEPMNYPNVSERLAEWIGDGCHNNLKDFARSVWQCMPVPAHSSSK
jgi:uncharacterized protein (TIGR00661 family)